MRPLQNYLQPPFVIPVKTGIQTKNKNNLDSRFCGNDRKIFYSPNSFGFTLVEALVAMSIFTIILLSTVDMMLIVIKAQDTTSRIQAITDNARASLELITKEMRTGIGYQMNHICTPPSLPGEIHFESTSGKRVYYFDPVTHAIYRAINIDITSPAQCFDALATGPQPFQPFTSPEVVVETFAFQLYGAAPGSSDGQPVVAITMKIKPSGALGAPVSVQTSVTRRVRDLP